MNFTNCLIQHDGWIIFSIIILVIIFGVSIFKDIAAALGFGVLATCFIFIIILPINYSYNNWDEATVYKTVPIEQLTLIELPDHTIQIWEKEKEITSLHTLQDVLKKDKIERIEYRRRELFGPDYEEFKVIFKE